MQASKRELQDFALELYKLTNGLEGDKVVLEYLQGGDLKASIQLIGFAELQDVPIAIWQSFDRAQFVLWRRPDGRRRRQTFRIPTTFIVDPLMTAIKNGLRAAFARKIDAIDFKELSRWFPDLEPTSPAGSADWDELHKSLTSALASVAASQHAQSNVYIKRDEWSRFFDTYAANGKTLGGRKPLESDQFWIEFIALLAPQCPNLQHKQLVSDLLEAIAPAQPSQSWVKQRVTDVAKRMKWNLDRQNRQVLDNN